MEKCAKKCKKPMEKCEKAQVEVPPVENNSVWASVAGAAVEFIEAQGDAAVTKAEVIQGVIDSHKASLVPKEKIEELVDAMLLLFVGNGILINNHGAYTKRTIQDVARGRGIEIEYRRKEDEKRKN